MADAQTSIDIAAPVQRGWEPVTDRDFPEELSRENRGTRFDRQNEFMLPAGEREAESSLARLKHTAEG